MSTKGRIIGQEISQNGATAPSGDVKGSGGAEGVTEPYSGDLGARELCWRCGRPGGWDCGCDWDVAYVSPTAINVVWDPKAVGADQYEELMNAIGDFVRKHGMSGIRLLRSNQAITLKGLKEKVNK